MTPNEKDYMDRYIYQVIRRLSKAQRDEVRMELEELISDMYTDKGSMEEALTELGDPAEFAKQYQGDQRYLIGPEYFDTYLWFVKVVIVCAAIPILLISLINAIGEMPAITAQNSASVIIRAIVDGLITGITDAILSCVSAFGAVTLTFAIMERKKVQFELKKEEKWSLESLSGEGKTPTSRSRWTPKFLEPVPDKKAIISRGDSIVGIIFIVIFSVLLIFAPHFFAAFFTEGETVMTVPIFNLEQWGIVLPVFILSLLIGLADEILRLVVGVYCRLVMISKLIGHLYSRHLNIAPSTQMRAVELDGESIVLPTDYIFDLGAGKPKFHVPVKTSTRERVVEVWAQQRILDGAFGVGRFICLLTCIGETNLEKNMSVGITCVPNQWMNYQLFVSQIKRAYYLDVPDKYNELNNRFPRIHVKEFGEFFHESDNLYD